MQDLFYFNDKAELKLISECKMGFINSVITSVYMSCFFAVSSADDVFQHARVVNEYQSTFNRLLLIVEFRCKIVVF